jgi:hypothetical protein
MQTEKSKSMACHIILNKTTRLNLGQCDETSPKCSYCTQRRLECVYPQKKQTESPSISSSAPDLSADSEIIDLDHQVASNVSTSLWREFDAETQIRNVSVEIPSWLVPAAHSAAGQLTKTDIELLHYYKARTWKDLTVRDEEVIHNLNREWVPIQSMSHPYLLYSILSLTAAHSHALSPSAKMQNLADVYRQKTLNAYNKALENITNDNYETLLVTAVFMQIMVRNMQE